MNTYLAGQIVTVTTALTDDAGAPISATAVSYRVLNEAGTVLAGPTVVDPWVSGAEEVSVVVSALNNTLGAGVLRSLRTIELTLTTASGTRVLTDAYIVEALEPLAVPTNSFQLLGAAELIAVELPGLTGWAAATRAQKIAALIQARLNISQLPFRYTFEDPMTHLEPEFGVSDIKLLTEAEFNELSAEFMAALVRAQVYEADDLLGGDPYEKKRRAGIMSETIGESSMMFRPGSPWKGPVCEKALRLLSKYVVSRTRIGRA